MHVSLSLPQIRSLETELFSMKERIAEIELTLSLAKETVYPAISEWNLSKSQIDIMRVLAIHSPCPCNVLAERALAGRIDDISDPQRLISVQIHKIRKKIAATGGVISHDFDCGYALDETSRRLMTGRRDSIVGVN